MSSDSGKVLSIFKINQFSSSILGNQFPITFCLQIQLKTVKNKLTSFKWNVLKVNNKSIMLQLVLY